MASRKFGEVSFYDSEKCIYIRLMVSRRKRIKVIEHWVYNNRNSRIESIMGKGRFWFNRLGYKVNVEEIVKDMGCGFLLYCGLLNEVTEEEINKILEAILW